VRSTAARQNIPCSLLQGSLKNNTPFYPAEVWRGYMRQTRRLQDSGFMLFYHFFTKAHLLSIVARPLKNVPFYPIPASGSNFNPRNTQCMSVVKIFAFLGLEQN
jgi:hypothetical protein